MIINTTFVIDPQIEKIFIEFLRRSYIPKAETAAILSMPRICKIVPKEEEEEAVSIAVQFYVESPALYETWQKVVGCKLEKMVTSKYGNRAMSFSTMMEELPL